MFLIAGLGNAGPKYADHRHNLGFMAADAIHEEYDFSPWRARFQALTAEGTIGGIKTLLIKPTTFMNESGRAVGEAVRFYKIPLEDMVAIYDELDLPPGKVRMKTGGGAGGHNGIRSLDAHIGKEYRRMRIGIGHPGDKSRVTGHVLGDFAKADHDWLDPLLQTIAENADLLAKGEDASFMNKVHMVASSDEPAGAKGAAAKNKSHIRQAQQSKPQVEVPTKGPMADMLKKLFGAQGN